MIIAAMIMITYGLTLTLAPAVRYHAGSERYQFRHWLGVIVWIASFSFLYHQSTRKFPNQDPYLLPVVALLSGIGLMTIWRLYPNLGLRQTVWIALSTLIVWVGIQYPEFLAYLRRYKYIWLISSLILTGLTIILGSNPSGIGSTRWLRIFGLHFQPSEPLKLLLITYLAGFFTDQVSMARKYSEIFLPPLTVTGTAMLLLFFQRDLGTASIILLLYLAILFTTQGNKLVLWLTPIVILTAGAIGYFTLDIVRLRFDTWLNPFGDPIGASYQIIQSIIAIAEGSLIGTGPGLGSPGLIPVSASDFIFSAIAEELGFLGITIIILLIIILIYRGVRIAMSTENSFHRYLTLGLVFYFGLQSIMIIGGNIGVIPLTGVTLPLVSYGGSSMVVSFSALLILLTISHQTPLVTNLKLNQHPRFAFISGLMITVLLLQIFVTSLISFWFMPSLTNRPENPRWIVADRFRERGNIVDRNNQIIITNTGEVGGYQRTSNHIPLYPVVGYTSPIYGQTGIEASMFSYLRGYEGYPFLTRLEKDLFYNQPPEGLNVRLTIDLSLQKTADKLLDKTPGTALLMNANSGEILVMASHPFIDAAKLITDWDDLVTAEDAPLVNRTTQGKYPPGAALFPFVMTKNIMGNHQFPDLQTMLPNLDHDLQCARPPTEALTWQTLIINGCRTAQFDLAEIIGAEILLDLYQDLGFFTEPNMRLTVAEADPPSIIDSEAFFRGEKSFNISPLQMARATSALTNQGILPAPRIVNDYQDSQGNWINLPKLTSNTQVLPLEVTFPVTALLQKPYSSYWQVVATTTTEELQTITWFIAGTTAEWQGQPYTVVVVIERETPALATLIGESLLDQAIRMDPTLNN
jgi:cell division protein FtsW (lipid II flippase)